MCSKKKKKKKNARGGRFGKFWLPPFYINNVSVVRDCCPLNYPYQAGMSLGPSPRKLRWSRVRWCSRTDCSAIQGVTGRRWLLVFFTFGFLFSSPLPLITITSTGPFRRSALSFKNPKPFSLGGPPKILGSWSHHSLGGFPVSG